MLQLFCCRHIYRPASPAAVDLVLLGEAARHSWCSGQEPAEGLDEDMKMWSLTQDQNLLRRLSETPGWG